MSETETTQTQAEAAAPQKSEPIPATFRTILGEKVGMTQLFHPKYGELCGVTIVKAGPCSVLRVKAADGPDGYDAVQLCYGAIAAEDVAVPVAGQYKKAGVAPARVIKEYRVASVKGFSAGQTVSVAEIFKLGDYVDVQGVCKGKGFAGVMKRHNFRGLPASHGASDKERSPGSLASRRALGRVLPGQRMAGHLGNTMTTVHKLEVIKVDAQENLIYVNGPVPGPKGGLITITETVKARKVRREPTAVIRKTKMGTIIGKTPSKAAKK